MEEGSVEGWEGRRVREACGEAGVRVGRGASKCERGYAERVDCI